MAEADSINALADYTVNHMRLYLIKSLQASYASCSISALTELSNSSSLCVWVKLTKTPFCALQRMQVWQDLDSLQEWYSFIRLWNIFDILSINLVSKTKGSIVDSLSNKHTLNIQMDCSPSHML